MARADHALFVLALAGGLGCTRPNPAFDERGASEVGDEVAETDESAESSESGDASGDLPDDPRCDFSPNGGLALALGSPADFSGNCPTGFDIWARVAEAQSGSALLSVCTPGCESCDAMSLHPLSTFPLIVTDALPADASACLRVQARNLVFQTADTCLWGALSIVDPEGTTPHLIAIAHSAEPSPLGQATLAGPIPEPVFVANCNCEAIGSDTCCLEARASPEFWGLPSLGGPLLPGERAPLAIPDPLDVEHELWLVQAQRTFACEEPGLQLSWAITPK